MIQRTQDPAGKREKAAFVGGGMIGTALAVNAAVCGFPVAVQTRSRVGPCRDRAAAALDFLQQKELVAAGAADAALERIVFTTDIRQAVEGARFIQESVPDDLEIKRQTVAQIERHAAADAVIATSTSSLSVTAVFAQAAHPERCLGGHPYHPAYLLPLVEITRGERTGRPYLERARAFYAAIGKEPVVLQKESVGFIANRFQSAIHRELIDLVMNGVCSVEDADKAMVYSVGVRWGVIGQAMILHLGAGPAGLAGFCEKYGVKAGVPDPRFSALASWNAYPEGWDRVLAAGVEEELRRRDPAAGNDMESVSRWRDEMLAAILKLHKKR